MTALSFDVFWRDHGAQKGLQNLGRQAASTKSSFDAFAGAAGSGLVKVGAAAAKFGAAGVAALAATGAAAAGYGIKVASANEQASISFTTMLGSAAKARKFLGELQKFAASTPFEFPELQTAASSLISAGIEADKVIPIMRTLGDVTSGMGTGSEGVKRATIALQQMSAAGRITGEDLNQLRDAGIPVFDLLASATGKSKKEVVELAQAGKLGSKELAAMMKALETGAGLERFSGLMDKQSRSLAGMWSTVKDVTGQALAGIATEAFPLLKSGLEGVSGGLERMSGWVKDNREEIGLFFRAAGTSAKTFGRITSGVFGAFVGSAAEGKASFSDFARWLDENQAKITSVMVSGGGAALAFSRALGFALSAGIKGFGLFQTAQNTTMRSYFQALSGMAHAAAVAFGWVPGIGEKLRAADAASQSFTNSVVAATRKAEQGTRDAAAAIDNTMIPAIDAAQRTLDKLGKTEIAKAGLRDSARRAANAIGDIGNKANGSQLHLKTWTDRTKLGTMAQAQLSTNIYNAQTALRAQYGAVVKAKGGQEALTAAWKVGRQRLYEEFKQMGLSEKEAKKLADRYAKVPPKVRTAVEQPGMKRSKEDAATLRRMYGDIPKTVTTKLNWDTAVDGINTKLTYRYGRGAKLISASGPDERTPGISGAPLAAPGRASGGPAASTFRAVHSAGTNAAVSHGTDATADLLKQLAPQLGVSPGSPGGLVGTVSRSMAATIAAMQARGARSFTTYPGHHPSPAKARDVTPHSWDIANAARASSSVWYVIYRMMIASKNHGNVWRPYRPTNFRGDWQHVRHVHVGWYDRGGITRDLHAGGRPERVLSPVQTRAFEHMVRVMDRGGGVRNTTIVANFPNYVGDKADLKRALVDMSRRGDLAVIFR